MPVWQLCRPGDTGTAAERHYGNGTGGYTGQTVCATGCNMAKFILMHAEAEQV
jgi:hypothetical protein